MLSADCLGNAAKKVPATEAAPCPPAQLTPEGVFHTYGGRIYHLARRLLEHEADAEDVTQEVLLQVVRKLDTFRGEAQLPTWLHRVTVNAVLGLRRQKSYRPEPQSAAPLGRGGAADADWALARPRPVAPDDQAVRRETQRLIERAIAQLPPRYRDVLVLSDVEQFSNPEIAGRLGLSLPAVKSRLHRARGLMRQALAPYVGEVGV